uniref:Uncharacterized protein n=1 Tax=Vitis vinifera TaxID=29760 RepID=F6HVS0_VITVI
MRAKNGGTSKRRTIMTSSLMNLKPRGCSLLSRSMATTTTSRSDKAENVVPVDLHRKTPVKVGATAGLRALGIDASNRILQAVKNFLKVKSTLKSKPEWVTVLDGMQEGAF